MASVQGTPEQVQHVQKLIQEIIEQVISLNSLPFSSMEYALSLCDIPVCLSFVNIGMRKNRLFNL